MDMTKMTIKPNKPAPLNEELETGEDGAKIIIVRKPFQPRKGKRKPMVPNKDGVDRIIVVSSSKDRVDISCRLLYKDDIPQPNTRIKIVLPSNESVEQQVLAKQPNLPQKNLKKAVDKWKRKFVAAKLKRLWKNNQPTQEKLIVDDGIWDVE